MLSQLNEYPQVTYLASFENWIVSWWQISVSATKAQRHEENQGSVLADSLMALKNARLNLVSLTKAFSDFVLATLLENLE